jgi:hypothetical protein
MPELLLIDVALCVLLVVLAGCVMMVRRRRRRDQAAARAEERPGTAAEPTGNGMARRETAVVPGFGDDPAASDLDAGAPAKPEHAARSQVSGATPNPDGPRAERNEARPATDRARAGPDGPQPERDGARAGPDGPQAERNGTRAPDGARAGPDTPGVAPNGQPAAAATASDPIGSYYDKADRAMSDYLAALGWTEEPGTRHTG